MYEKQHDRAASSTLERTFRFSFYNPTKTMWGGSAQVELFDIKLLFFFACFALALSYVDGSTAMLAFIVHCFASESTNVFVMDLDSPHEVLCNVFNVSNAARDFSSRSLSLFPV